MKIIAMVLDCNEKNTVETWYKLDIANKHLVVKFIVKSYLNI